MLSPTVTYRRWQLRIHTAFTPMGSGREVRFFAEGFPELDLDVVGKSRSLVEMVNGTAQKRRHTSAQTEAWRRDERYLEFFLSSRTLIDEQSHCQESKGNENNGSVERSELAPIMECCSGKGTKVIIA